MPERFSMALDREFAARTKDGRIARRAESSRAARASAFRKSHGPAARRAHQQPGPRFRPLAPKIFVRLRRRAHRDFARPPFSEQRLHAHRGHRLRNLIMYVGGYDDMV